MGEDIFNQLIDQMKERKFSLQLDEATDNNIYAHLVCYDRFVDFSEQNLVEELLFCKHIELGCRGIDLFNIIDNFISKNNLDRKKCISIRFTYRRSQTYVGQLLRIAKSNRRTCTHGKMDALHGSP